jgi:hypothetical protein
VSGVGDMLQNKTFEDIWMQITRQLKVSRGNYMLGKDISG